MESRKFDHGMVDEPIPAHSHIFGGEWYEEKVRAYGEPSDDMLEIAVRACQNIKKYLGIDIEWEDTMKKKVAVQQQPPQLQTSTIYVDYIEDEDVIEVDTIIEVKLEKMVINSETVFVDIESGTVYKIHATGGMGPSIGRWNSEKKILEELDESG